MHHSGKILVTGATGHIGRRVVAQLDRIGRAVRAVTRSPESAGLPPRVELARADFAEPATLDPWLDDVDAAFLVWTAPVATAADVIQRIAARVPRIVLVTSPHQTPHPFFQQPNALRAVHAELDRLVETSGAAWTILRPAIFALTSLWWWGAQIRTGDVVRWFHGDAAAAPVHEDDLAAVAVCALCEPGHNGRDYVLTGPESLTQREQLAAIAHAIGRPLRFEELSEPDARAELLAIMPPPVLDLLLPAYRAAVGRPAFVTATVSEVTGVPARTFSAWARDHAAEFMRQPA